MFHLANDPNPAALGNWSAANFTGTTPIDKLPEGGSLLVSSLSILTLEQFSACIAAGIKLVSVAEAIDCRPHTGLGDWHWSAMVNLLPVIQGWATGKPVEAGNTMSALQAEKAAMLERMGEMLAELQSLRHPMTLDAVAIPENLPADAGDSTREPQETGSTLHGSRPEMGGSPELGGTLPAAEMQSVESSPGVQSLSTRANGRFVRRKPTTP